MVELGLALCTLNLILVVRGIVRCYVIVPLITKQNPDAKVGTSVIINQIL